MTTNRTRDEDAAWLAANELKNADSVYAQIEAEKLQATRDLVIREQIQRDKNHALSAVHAVQSAVSHVAYLVAMALDMANANGDDDAMIELISAELALEATTSRVEHLHELLSGE